MPAAASSTQVARSSCWSWTRRESTLYRRSNHRQSAVTGANTAAVSNPSSRFSLISRITIAMKLAELVIMKTMPKLKNRLIAERSVVALDRSWPDCH